MNLRSFTGEAGWNLFSTGFTTLKFQLGIIVAAIFDTRRRASLRTKLEGKGEQREKFAWKQSWKPGEVS